MKCQKKKKKFKTKIQKKKNHENTEHSNKI